MAAIVPIEDLLRLEALERRLDAQVTDEHEDDSALDDENSIDVTPEYEVEAQLGARLGELHKHLEILEAIIESHKVGHRASEPVSPVKLRRLRCNDFRYR